jgi:hypothetical protein
VPAVMALSLSGVRPIENKTTLVASVRLQWYVGVVLCPDLTSHCGKDRSYDGARVRIVTDPAVKASL